MTRPLALLVAFALCSCAAPSLHPFPAEVGAMGGIRTIACASARAPGELHGRDLAERVGGLLADRFGRRGITVLHHHLWEECFEKAEAMEGGLFDARTGQVNRPKFKRAWHYCADDLHRRYGVDAILLPRIGPVTAEVVADVARWHGVEEEIRSAKERFWSGGSAHGSVSAASLFVSIIRVDGTPTFRNAGGLLVLEAPWGPPLKQRVGTIATWERLARAVDIALEPILPAAG